MITLRRRARNRHIAERFGADVGIDRNDGSGYGIVVDPDTRWAYVTGAQPQRDLSEPNSGPVRANPAAGHQEADARSTPLAATNQVWPCGRLGLGAAGVVHRPSRDHDGALPRTSQSETPGPTITIHGSH
jgi:hypothetical protein